MRLVGVMQKKRNWAVPVLLISNPVIPSLSSESSLGEETQHPLQTSSALILLIGVSYFINNYQKVT